MLTGRELSLADEQARMNQSTRGQWDWYANHRRHIERLIVPERRGGRICVLGAGNCNDLDLKWLIEAYSEVYLVDIDPSALERGVKRQGVDLSRVTRHAPVDLTRIADLTAGWKGRAVRDDEVRLANEVVVEKAALNIGGDFDVVLSPCVLSQLLCGVRDLVGKHHPAWPDLKAAIRQRHLRDLTRLIGTGGRGVLVVDLASTSAVGGLDRAREDDLAGIMTMCVRDGKCFRGLEPGELLKAIGAINREGEAKLMTPVVSAPWLWHLGWGKAFLVYGMTVGRSDLGIMNRA
jgi:hypothetical protein